MPPARKPGAGIWSGPSASAGNDPTANVLFLVEAMTQRQDDLRIETNRRLDTEIACVKEISGIRATHLKTIGEMRVQHADAMANAEKSRLDAVRAVDVLNGTMAAERAQQAVHVLAATSKTDAENLRTALATTATTIAQQNAATVAGMTDRLGALEQFMYKGQGKSTVEDPMMAAWMADVKTLLTTGTGAMGGARV